MTAWLVGASLRWGRLLLALSAAILAVGIGALGAASVDVYPEFAPTGVQVQTEALGLSAAEVESLVTVPLEQDLLNGVPWLDHVSSTSTPGLSSIDVVFATGTDPLEARQVVQERMTQIRALPNVGTPPIMVQPLASISRVAMIGLSPTDRSTRALVDMSYRARWTIRSRLTGVPGVANVLLYGQRDRQLQVRVDPARMKAHGTTLADVVATTGNSLWVSPLSYLEANTPGTGGYIESPNQRLAIQHILPISTAQDLSHVALSGDHAGSARLGDVASVVVDHQPMIGDAVTSTGPGMVLVVEKFPGASTRAVTQGVESAMAALEPGLSGLHVDTRLYRPASYLDSALHHLGLAGLLSLVLLVLVLAALLYSWRLATVVVVSVTMSLLTAAVVLQLAGAAFTALTLVGFAAALAVVVDGAVADALAVRATALRGRPETPEPAAAAVSRSFLRGRSTSLPALLVVLLLALPAWFVGPFASSFSRPLLVAVALALAVSVVVALTLAPTLTALLLALGTPTTRVGPVAGWLQRRCTAALRENLRHPRVAAAALCLLALSALLLAPQLGRGRVLPVLQDRSLLVSLRTLPGTSLPEMSRVTGSVASEVRALPGVADVGVHVGRAVSADTVADVSSGEIWVTMSPSAPITSTRAAVTAVVSGYPGVAAGVHTYADERLTQPGVPAGDVVVRVYGKDGPGVSAAAERVARAAKGVAGVRSASVERAPSQPAVEVAVNLQAARRAGLAPGDVRRTVTTMMSACWWATSTRSRQSSTWSSAVPSRSSTASAAWRRC